MATRGELELLERQVRIIPDAETVEQEIGEQDIMSLLNSPGWRAVVKELESEKKGLEAEIFDINGGLSDADIERKRIQRYYLDKLINLPEEKAELFMSRRANTPDENI